MLHNTGYLSCFTLLACEIYNLLVAPRMQSTLQLIFNFKSCSSLFLKEGYFTIFRSQKNKVTLIVESSKNYDCGNYQPYADVRRHLAVADRFNASSNFNYHHFANLPQIVLHTGERSRRAMRLSLPL